LQRKGVLHQFASEIIAIDGHKIQVTLDGVMSGNDKEQNIAFLYIADSIVKCNRVAKMMVPEN
jgi:hypothetical protein